MELLDTVRERLRLSLWFIPGVFALGATIGALVLLAVDRRLVDEGQTLFRFGGTADAARDVLSTIAQSMLTFTGLVFTITMLVLQLAANQLSPRVMRTFLRDRQNQAVLGLFIATFLFTLLVLREVRSSATSEPFVPELSIWAAFALLVASIAAFVIYIDHMAHLIRASTVISTIGTETRAAIDRHYPPDAPDEQSDADRTGVGPRIGVVEAGEGGTLVAVDTDGLVKAAVEANIAIEVVPMVGDFVPAAAPLFLIYGQEPSEEASGSAMADRVRRHAWFEVERTLQQDVAFGFRQLVDIGARALSPGTNDPTTAVQAIDQVHDLLRQLVRRPFPPALTRDEAGTVRLIANGPQWDDYVALAFDELRLYGAGHIQVMRRLAHALRDLLSIAPAERSGSLMDQLARLDRAIARDFPDRRDRAWAETGSARGQGPPDDRGE